MTDDAPPPGSLRGRILEAVLIAMLTTAGTELVEAIAEHLKKRRKRKRKPRRPTESDAEEETTNDQADQLDVGAPWHVYPPGEGHNTDGGACWCKPEVQETEGGGRVIVHNIQVC